MANNDIEVIAELVLIEAEKSSLQVVLTELLGEFVRRGLIDDGRVFLYKDEPEPPVLEPGTSLGALHRNNERLLNLMRQKGFIP